MEIDKAIKQKSFKSEYERLAINILYTAGWINALNVQRFKPYRISPQQYNVLRILRGQYPNPATVNLIQERMLDPMSNVSRLVEKLRERGLVERRTCETDRRACDVLITPEGLEVLEAIDQTHDEWEKNFQSLSRAEARELNRLLDKLRA